MSIVGVDTGGTFTDVVALTDGALTVLKVPSTPDDPARAVLEGVRAALPAGRPFALVHGSTVATNTLLERTGARVALITNRGFEDVIEIGRQNRPQLYAIVGHRPPPLVARPDRHGIAGRIGPDGAEVEPLDEDELAALRGRLTGAEAVAICLLHSYAAPDHEERVAAALEGLGLPLSVSVRLLPEYREYERTATTVVNAYVASRMDAYLGRLADSAGAERIRVMGSGGGAIPVERARREPVHTVLSGPAGGVAGALRVAGEAGIRNILTFDMGGTSTDVSLCPGEPLHTREFTIAGLPVAVPVLDIHTVGAGGGSIAEVDAGGALRVGPRSAGADPGPICYGRGGRRVTVTDAHAWLGRLPSDVFLGGEAPLDRAAVEGPLRELAAAIGTDSDAAAEGILAVADTAMEGALRVISIERGHDPADFTLVPFGGAAGLHVAELAHRLGVTGVLVPPDPGVLSAYGMLASPVRKEAARSVLLRDEAAPDGAPAIYGALEEEALSAMQGEGIAAADVTLRRFADARYAGQSFELRVQAEGWADAFHRAHAARYGFDRPGAAVELVTARVEASGPAPIQAGPRAARARQAGEVREEAGDPERTGSVIYGGERLDARVVRRSALHADETIEGPAVIHEYSATLWVPPGWSARVLDGGSLSMRRGSR
ncbi:MAG: hydantoinase/oxoprolinase family protein [Gemmatimonadetes bacterium]|nr:hydantoinase/oxoprolinase family protein [Gemmatimonadota bacterium]